MSLLDLQEEVERAIMAERAAHSRWLEAIRKGAEVAETLPLSGQFLDALDATQDALAGMRRAVVLIAQDPDLAGSGGRRG